MELNEKAVLDALSNVIDPNVKKGIVELGFVSDIQVDGQKVSFKVKTNNPTMHSKRRMMEACEFAIQRVLGEDVKADVEIVPLKSDEQSFENRRILPGVKNIIAVASGKGGVGKSTIAVNLAVGLAKRGFKVGFVDADIYGPSAPTMFDTLYDKPSTIKVNDKEFIKPVESYGVQLLSIGFFADVDQAIVWRGPMASKALNQMFGDAHWGALDYMIIDLPPGTGDIHLSLVQAVPLTGAVIVSTPQEVALTDARKGVAMFQLNSVNVPVLGIVENMSWFTPEELPENKYFIFGKDGAANLAEKLNVKLLGQVPLVQSIREAGDVGRPAVLQDQTPVSQAFEQIIDNFVEEVEQRNADLPPTSTVKMSMNYPKQDV